MCYHLCQTDRWPLSAGVALSFRVSGPLDPPDSHTIYAHCKAVRCEQRSPAMGVRCLDHSTTTAGNKGNKAQSLSQILEKHKIILFWSSLPAQEANYIIYDQPMHDMYALYNTFPLSSSSFKCLAT